MKLKVVTAWSLLIGIGAAISVTPTAFAQTTSVQPLQNLQENPNNFDFFTDPERSSGAGLLNLINQVKLLNERSLDEFTAEQADNLDAAAAEFRAQQRQQIQTQPPQSNSPTVDLTPAE
ncbi:MAG TPA: hypothetical protein V6D03_05005 [Candidatus Caenarcaniphilales bacterium]